jgi:hypothetical protein
MGTRSAIGYKRRGGKIRAKYSHFDGYVAGAGKTLQEHYQEARKIAQMVELGDQKCMSPEIFPMPGSGHSFETPEEGVTIFYGRDRGESNTDAVEFDTVQEFVEHYTDSGCEYFYLHTAAGWIVHRLEVGNDANGYPIFDTLEEQVQIEVARLKAEGYDI